MSVNSKLLKIILNKFNSYDLIQNVFLSLRYQHKFCKRQRTSLITKEYLSGATCFSGQPRGQKTYPKPPNRIHCTEMSYSYYTVITQLAFLALIVRLFERLEYKKKILTVLESDNGTPYSFKCTSPYKFHFRRCP